MDQHDNSNPSGGEPESRLPAPRPPETNQGIALSQQQKPLALLLSGRDGGEEDGALDLMAYWRAIVKRKWLVVLLVLLVGTWSTIDTLLTPKIYRASATIEISYGQTEVVNVGEVNAAATLSGAYFETQQQLIRSRSLAQRVVSDLGLAGSGEFQRLQPPSSWDQVLAFLGAAAEVVEPVGQTSPALPRQSARRGRC